MIVNQGITMNKVRWGIIGCGDVVKTKSGPSFNRVDRSSIEAVSCRDMLKARDCAKYLGAKKYYNNYKELVADKDVDAIYIATPPGMHLEHALYCLEHKKPVYIEKPFARNYLESKQIVEAFQLANVRLYVAHYRRAHLGFLKLLTLIEKKVIGEIYTCEGSLSRRFEDSKNHEWLFNSKISGGGKFFDIAPHMIDILIFLFGKVTSVKAFCQNVNGTHFLEEIVVAILRFDNNILGTLNYNLSTDTKEDKVILRGSGGKIEFSIHGESPIVITRNKKEEYLDIKNPQYIQEPMISAVVDDLLGNNPSVCYGTDALETYRVIDMILGDFYNNRERNFWED